jgi:hypothetical protein
MKTLLATLTMLLLLQAGVATAVNDETCPVPAFLLFGDNELPRVAEAAKKNRRIDILVVGTTSSTLGGTEGNQSAYPARMEAAFKRRLPGIEIKLVTHVRPRTLTADLAKDMTKLVVDEKPALVIWQTGTVDAMRAVEPESFRSVLDEGVDMAHAKGADVILMNMQYSPRTETMIAVHPYAEIMRWVAQQDGATLFDRLALMRYWNDTGAFDLYAATKDFEMAKRVHDCIGRALASQIIEAAHLGSLENVPSR